MQANRPLGVVMSSFARHPLVVSALVAATAAGCSSEADDPSYGAEDTTGTSSDTSASTSTNAVTSTSTSGSTSTVTTTTNTSTTTGTTGGGTTTGGGPTTSGTTSTSGTSTTTGGFGMGNNGAGGSSTGTDTSTTTSTSTTGSSTSGGDLPKFVGNITTGFNAAADTNGRTFSTYWDQITPENAGKWGSVQSNASGAFNWSTLDSIYDYAQNSGIIFKQHVFIWGSQQPGGSIGETEVKNWMREFCARYPETRLIDVVNEPPPHTEANYTNAIGGGTNGSWQWVINAFNWAREACPNAILILNDYNNIEWADQNQHFINIAKTVKDSGAPIDAVGAQAHGLSSGVSTDTMKNLLNKLHNDTGLPVYITEYDINQSDDNAQLTKYQEHIPYFLETEWIHGITIWGWIYGSTWVASSGLIRNGSPRPAMTWLMQELNRPAP